MSDLSGLIRLTDPDIGLASKTLARAFIIDPMVTYIFPSDPETERKLALLFAVIIRYGITYGEVYATSVNAEGVAMWLASDNSDMDLTKLKKCGLVDFSSQVSTDVISRIVYFNDFAYSRNKVHAPFKHWYLAFIGVDPAFCGKGFASALIKPMLARLDREKIPCYLETLTEKNAAMYKHYGFKLAEEINIPGTDLDLFAMLR